MGTFNRQVVITGIGLINPLGTGRESVWREVTCGRSGLILTPDELKEVCSPVCGLLSGVDLTDFLRNRKTSKLMGRDSLLAIKASGEALIDAGWGDQEKDLTGLFVSTGLTYGSMDELFPIVADAMGPEGFSIEVFGSRSLYKCNPLMSFKILNNMPACHISIEHGISGHNLVLNSWPDQGALAVGEAFYAIKRGDMDFALAGAGESRLHFAAAQTMMHEEGIYKGEASDNGPWSMPLDKKRKGAVPSEGAAFVFMEALESATRRKVPMYAEMLGFGLSNAFSEDQADSVRASCEAVARAMKELDADRREVGIINASASSCTGTDRLEGLALEKMAGTRPVWTPKAFYGEMGAASFCTSLALGALAISRGILPPTISITDPEFNLNLTPGRAVRADIDLALVTSFESACTKAAAFLGRV